MYRRIIALCASGIALAAVAQAAIPKVYSSWSVTAALKQPTDVLNSATIAPGEGTQTFNNLASKKYTIQTSPGYDIRTLIVDGRSRDVTNPDLMEVTFANNRLQHTLVAYTVAEKYSVLTESKKPAGSKQANGSFVPATLKNVPYNVAKQIRVIPAKGYKIKSVTTYALDDHGEIILASASPVSVTDLPEGNEIALTYSSTSGKYKLVAEFEKRHNVNPVISPTFPADATKRMLDVSRGPVTFELDAFRSTSAIAGNVSYAWSVTGTGATLDAATGLKTKITITDAGNYTLTLKVSDGTPAYDETATVSFIAYVPGNAGTCGTCHIRTKDTSAFTQYAASKHATGPSCENCHGNHQIWVNPKATCINCHNGEHGITSETTMKAICVTCHTKHIFESNVATFTCIGCHADTKERLDASTHVTGTHVPAGGLTCASCHSATDSIATYGGAGTGCQFCHQEGSSYGIYNADMSLKAPHGDGATTVGTATGGTSKTQWVTQGLICSDCHGHNNNPNMEWAESGHGEVSNNDMNAFTHYDWNTRVNDGTRTNGNCGRCHTAYGFIKFLNQTTSMTRLRPVSGQANAVLACIGCHKSADTGELRLDGTPAPGMRLSSGYPALFTASGLSNVEIQFPNYKNSNICIPCHSGRTTEKIIKDSFAYLPTMPGKTSMYQHAANPGQTFLGTGAYQFVNGSYAGIVNPHKTVRMGPDDKKGPCVGCHNAHSLKANDYTVCQVCHGPSFGATDVAAAKAVYEAAVKALRQQVEEKIQPLFANNKPITEERTDVQWDAGTGDRTLASKNYGAWYNWHVLTNADPGGYVHNPGYVKKVIIDTIDYLDDGEMNDSTFATVQASTTLSDEEKTLIMTLQ